MYNEYKTFREIVEEYPEIKKYYVYDLFPKGKALNQVKTIYKINENWEHTIVQKPLESDDDLLHPKFKVVDE